jgi:hypothetical protein
MRLMLLHCLLLSGPVVPNQYICIAAVSEELADAIRWAGVQGLDEEAF